MSARVDCMSARQLLALVPGSELPPELDGPVREHIAACAACRRELGHYVRARRALRSLVPAGGGDDAFFAELRADTLAAVRAASPRRRVPIAGLATAAALFLLGVYMVSAFLPGRSIGDLPVIVPTPRAHADDRIPEVGFHSDYYGLLGRLELSNTPPGARIGVAIPAVLPKVPDKPR